MSSPEVSEKIYVEDDKATIICPFCHRNKTISVSNFKNQLHEMQAHCNCGHNFTLQLEFRRYIRKEASLTGDYNLENPSNIESGHTRVVDLSIQGACFEVTSYHDIVPEMEGELVFTLDDGKHSVLFRRVIIRSVRGSRIGCEFIENNPSSEELDFYLKKL